ncbi:MAG TPA: PIN domain-containing protein [Armatimonadota bacterium]|jgi:predicted nucleic acid-binding protein
MSSSAPRYVVDANVILRYLLADNPELTAKARALWQAVDEGLIVVECDPVTLAEVVFVLSSNYKLPNAEISAGLSPLLVQEGVEMVSKERYLHALELFAGPVRHFGDACACAAALEASGGELFSFDRKLSSVPGISRSEQAGV